MTSTLPNVAYIVASFLFIMSLKGLSQPSTSRRGNQLGTIGMILAIVVTAAKLFAPEAGKGLALPTLTTAGLLAAAIGVGLRDRRDPRRARRDDADARARRDAAQLRGLAAVLVGIVSKMHADGGVGRRRRPRARGRDRRLRRRDHADGLVVAFLKLRGSVGGRPLLLPGRHALNLALVTGCAFWGDRGPARQGGPVGPRRASAAFSA
jgi:NAD(P) transhydrogenase subunit beta